MVVGVIVMVLVRMIMIGMLGSGHAPLPFQFYINRDMLKCLFIKHAPYPTLRFDDLIPTCVVAHHYVSVFAPPLSNVNLPVAFLVLISFP
jgi:hypothetical protein